MKSTNTTLHIATSTTMENPTSKDVKVAKLGNMYAQVIDLRKHGYSYKKIHDILGDVSYNYCAVICLTYYAIENDDYDVFYTNKSVHNYNYIIPWAIKTLGKDERIKELARIIGGVQITKNVLDTAEEMLGDKDNKPKGT